MKLIKRLAQALRKPVPMQVRATRRVTFIYEHFTIDFELDSLTNEILCVNASGRMFTKEYVAGHSGVVDGTVNALKKYLLYGDKPYNPKDIQR
jgi:collagenase-like PrtC family protease